MLLAMPSLLEREQNKQWYLISSIVNKGKCSLDSLYQYFFQLLISHKMLPVIYKKKKKLVHSRKNCEEYYNLILAFFKFSFKVGK